MGIFRIDLKPIVVTTIVALVLLSAASASGAPFDQTRGRILRLEPSRSTYTVEQEVSVQLEFENDQDVQLQYWAMVVFTAPSGSIVYDSDSEVEDEMVSLEPGFSAFVTFKWPIPETAAEGVYTVTASLRDWNDRTLVYDEMTKDAGVTFEVEYRPGLSILPFSWNFDNLDKEREPITLQREDIFDTKFTVSNPGSGILEWKVTEWPDWVDLISPKSKVSGRGVIEIEVEASTLLAVSTENIEAVGIIKLEDGIGIRQTREYEGEITVTSNVRTEVIPIIASITGIFGIEIPRFKVLKPSFYRWGEEVVIEFEAKRIDESQPIDYRAQLVIDNSSGFNLYDSNLEGADTKVSLEPTDDEDTTEIFTYR